MAKNSPPKKEAGASYKLCVVLRLVKECDYRNFFIVSNIKCNISPDEGFANPHAGKSLLVAKRIQIRELRYCIQKFVERIEQRDDR